jgi:SAM-dependent methyltransferase
VPTPEQLRVKHAYDWIGNIVRGCDRVLEVGCGHGNIARLLGREGIAVTAIDRELHDPRPSPGVRFVEKDFFFFTETGFDAIVFHASLHHLHPLDAAVAHAAGLIARGGMLVADEFDLDAPRALTARWYYETQELLASTGLYRGDHIDGAVDAEPRARWLDAHIHEPPLATGRQMLTTIASRFAIRETARCPYLFQYMCANLPDDSLGGAVAAHVLATEQRRVAAGTLDAVGLRIVAMAT